MRAAEGVGLHGQGGRRTLGPPAAQPAPLPPPPAPRLSRGGAPLAEKRPLTTPSWGVEASDDYGWLEDTGSPATTAIVAAQNALSRQYLDALPERAAIRAYGGCAA